MEDAEKLKYPGMRADISRCNALLHELCQIVWDRSYKAEQVVFSIPPVPRNFDMQFSAAFDELSAYRATGDVEELTALAKARDEGRVVVLPFVAMVEKSLQDGNMKPERDQRFNGRYAVVYSGKGKWGCPLIDICGTPYNSDQAEERKNELTRAEAEAALKGASDGDG